MGDGNSEAPIDRNRVGDLSQGLAGVGPVRPSLQSSRDLQHQAYDERHGRSDANNDQREHEREQQQQHDVLEPA